MVLPVLHLFLRLFKELYRYVLNQSNFGMEETLRKGGGKVSFINCRDIENKKDFVVVLTAS